MTQINAYIGFNGKCREAMTYYQECLGGELELQTVGESPMQHECPDGMKGQILHAALASGPLLLMGSDMIGPDGYQPGNNIALALSCASEEEINRCFEHLSTGGSVLQPLQQVFWGATFGVVSDKYGVRWMLNFDPKLHRN